MRPDELVSSSSVSSADAHGPFFSFSLLRENNVCDINPVHHLFATGTSEVSAMTGCV